MSSTYPASVALEPVTAHELVYLEVGVPYELRDAVERHHQNLNVLADQLRQAGLSESQATAHLDVAIASYRAALGIAAINMRSTNR